MKKVPKNQNINSRSALAAGDLASQIQARLHVRKGAIPLNAMSFKEIMRTYRILMVSGIMTLIFSLVWMWLPNPYATTGNKFIPLSKEFDYKLFNAPTASGVTTTYTALGFNPDVQPSESNMATAVPRNIVDRIPADIHLLKDASERKKLFLQIMLPISLIANSKVQQERRIILNAREVLLAGKPLSEDQTYWVNQIAGRYQVEWAGDLKYPSQLDEMLLRVNEVPTSLIVAQAAIESAWGTSRFALEGNALFGEWTTSKPGLVPLQRENGKNHKIRVFSTPLMAVESYLLNLNTHRAYTQLRNIRQVKGQSGGRATGEDLAVGLDKYSSKKQQYVSLIQSIIKTNALAQYDGAYLK